MKISELRNMLDHMEHDNGDIEVYIHSYGDKVPVNTDGITVQLHIGISPQQENYFIWDI